MSRPRCCCGSIMVIQVVLLLPWLFLGNAACLASSAITAAASPSAVSKYSAVIVSTQMNGGHARRFYLNGPTTRPPPPLMLPTSGALSPSPPPSFQDRWNVAVRQAKDVVRKESMALRWESACSRTVSGLRSTFLPVGYPLSVPTGYWQFSVWSWIQDLSTSMRAVLATQRVLQGVGVGSTTATALSAVQNFLVRDAAGMAATLLFTAAAAARFQTDVKRWRLLADIMVDIGISLEVAAVQLPPQFFLPALCVGNMCKAVCGVAAGATGGSIAVFWASKGTDISDINAKFGAQHTVTASLGLVFAALFAKSVSTAKLSVVWTLYSILTVLHIFANVRCMRLIAFQHFNTARLNMVLDDHFLDKWSAAESVDPLPTPLQVAAKEPLFFLPPRLRNQRNRTVTTKAALKLRRMPIRFGVSFNEFVERSGKNLEELRAVLRLSSSDQSGIHSDNIVAPSLSQKQPPYLISIGKTPRQIDCIVVALQEKASSVQQLQAYFHAMLLRRTIEEVSRQHPRNHGGDGKHTRVIGLTEAEIRIAEKVAEVEFPVAWNAFVNGCDKVGWDLTKTELQSQGYEFALRQ